MSRYYFTVSSTPMYLERYLEFLLEHYEELNMPYPFPVTLSFIGSPIIMEQECFLCFNEEDELIGVMGYIYGTGEHQYQDHHIVQIQVVFVLEPYRRTRWFLDGLQFLTQYMAQLEQKVQEIRFWAPAHSDLRRLFTKIANRTASPSTAFGTIDEYRASFPALQAYAAKYAIHEVYFEK